MEGLEFSQLLKKYRHRAGLYSLSMFADRLADEGVVYDISLISKWENGHRVPNDRQLLLILLRIFVDDGGIDDIVAAQEFLAAAGRGYLTNLELQTLFGNQADEASDLIQGVLKSYNLARV